MDLDALLALRADIDERISEFDAVRAAHHEAVRSLRHQLNDALDDALNAYVATRNEDDPEDVALTWVRYQLATCLAPTKSLIKMAEKHGLELSEA